MTPQCAAVRLSGQFCNAPAAYIINRRYRANLADRAMSFSYCRPHALEILMCASWGLLQHAVGVEPIRGTR